MRILLVLLFLTTGCISSVTVNHFPKQTIMNSTKEITCPNCNKKKIFEEYMAEQGKTKCWSCDCEYCVEKKKTKK